MVIIMKYSTEQLTQEAYIYGVIFSLANRLQSMGDQRDECVTTKQWFAMANIAMTDDYSLNVKDLARVLGTSSQNTKKLLNLLAQKDYVQLQKDAADSRNIRIALSDNGKLYYNERSEREAVYLNQLFQSMDKTQMNQLYDSLKLLSSTIIAKENL